MSHDRGCYMCGREPSEYSRCPERECVKKGLHADRETTKPYPKLANSLAAALHVDKVVPITAFAYDGKVYASEKEAKAAKQRVDLIALLREVLPHCNEPEELADYLIKNRSRVLELLP